MWPGGCGLGAREKPSAPRGSAGGRAAVGRGGRAGCRLDVPAPDTLFRRFVASNPGVFPAAVLQKGSRQALDALPEAEDQYGRVPGHAPELDPWGGSGAARIRQSPWTRPRGPFRGPREPLEILHLMVLAAFFMRPPHTFPRGRVFTASRTPPSNLSPSLLGLDDAVAGSDPCGPWEGSSQRAVTGTHFIPLEHPW